MASTVKKKRKYNVFMVLLFIAGAVLLYYVNPSETPLIPCLFRSLTGLECAGCGLTRASHQVLHGNFEAAWNFNPLIFVTVPVISYLVFRFILREWFGKQLPTIQMPLWLYIALGIAIIMFTVVRNLN